MTNDDNSKVARIDPEKLDLGSLDIAKEKIAQLKEMFPEVFTEGSKIDFDRLKLTLGETVDVGKERYGLNWPGKAECYRVIQQTSSGTLLPVHDESVNFDETENVIIEGDNLEVLKLLQKSYLGKVKMIYIDPPYNTGNDFIYPDNFSESLETYLKYTEQVDSEGRKYSTNSDTDGRFHSKWLNMMYPRLFLARNLLREDGVIFISIDDGEVDNLKTVCAEIFGEENLEGVITWRRRHNQPNDKTKMIGKVSEYVLCYARSSEQLKRSGIGGLPLTGDFSNPDGDVRGEWATKPWKAGSDQTGCRYKIETPSGNFLDEEWLGDYETYKKLEDDKRIVWPKRGDGYPRKKYFRAEREIEGQCATNWWPSSLFGHNQGANEDLTTLFGEKNAFSNPKPTLLIQGMLNIANTKNSLILDFFAGSGTTAHAVLDLNKQDGGNRKFILVQLPEPTDKTEYPTIADICKERVRRVITKLDKEEAESSKQTTLDFDNSSASKKQARGFKVFKLATSNFRVWNAGLKKDVADLQQELAMHDQNIEQGRTQDDILYEILLKSGFELSSKIEKLTLADKTVFSVADGAMFVCLEKKLSKEVIKEMANKNPPRVVCLDKGFANNDQLKTNAVETMKAKKITFKTV